MRTARCCWRLARHFRARLMFVSLLASHFAQVLLHKSLQARTMVIQSLLGDCQTMSSYTLIPVPIPNAIITLLPRRSSPAAPHSPKNNVLLKQIRYHPSPEHTYQDPPKPCPSSTPSMTRLSPVQGKCANPQEHRRRVDKNH